MSQNIGASRVQISLTNQSTTCSGVRFRNYTFTILRNGTQVSNRDFYSPSNGTSIYAANFTYPTSGAPNFNYTVNISFEGGDDDRLTFNDCRFFPSFNFSISSMHPGQVYSRNFECRGRDCSFYFTIQYSYNVPFPGVPNINDTKVCAGDPYQVTVPYCANLLGTGIRFNLIETYSGGSRTHTSSSNVFNIAARNENNQAHNTKTYRVYVSYSSYSSLTSGNSVPVEIYIKPPQLDEIISTNQYVTNEQELTDSNSFYAVHHNNINGRYGGEIIIYNVDGIGSYRYTLEIPIGAAHHYLNIDNPDFPINFPHSIPDIQFICTEGNCSVMQPILDSLDKGFSAGTYKLIIENIANGIEGCATTVSITVKEPLPLSVTPSSTNANCYGDPGSISVSASGGILPYTFFLTDEYHNSYPSQSVPDFNNLATSTSGIDYEVTVNDGYAPSKSTGNITLSSPEQINLTINDGIYNDGNGLHHIPCTGAVGNITGIISGGVSSYSSVPAGQIFGTNLSLELTEGTYTITISDGNNCSQSFQNIEITEASGVTFGSNIGTPDCVGEGTYARLKAESYYNFDPYDLYTYTVQGTNYNESQDELVTDSVEFFNLTEDTYDVTINYTIDGQICEDYSSFNVTNPDSIKIISNIKHIACNGDTAGSIQIELQNVALPISIININVPYGDDIFEAYNPDSFFQTFSPLIAGTYNFTILDSKGCGMPYTAVVNDTTKLVLSSTSTDISCYGANNGTATISASGGWFEEGYYFGEYPNIDSMDYIGDANTVYNDLSQGTHTYYVADTMGCIKSIDVNIIEPNPFIIQIENTINISCHDSLNGSIELSLDGGWMPYHIQLTNLNTGTSTFFNDIIAQQYTISRLDSAHYELLVADDKNCNTTLYANIQKPTALNLDSYNLTEPLCQESNGSIIVNISGGTTPYNFDWHKTGDLSFNSTEPNLIDVYSGIYSLLLLDANGCPLNELFTLSDADGPEGNIINIQPVTCFEKNDGGAEVQITNNPDLLESIIWQNGETGSTASLLSRNDTLVTLTDVNGCQLYLKYVIPSPELLTIEEISIISPTCVGNSDGSIEVSIQGGTPDYDFSWEDGQTEISLNGLTAGNYTANVTDNNNCQSSYTVVLNDPAPLLLDLGGDKTLCTGQTYSLSPSGYTSYEWICNDEIISTEQDMEFDKAGTYSLIVTNEDGCEASDEFELIISNDVLEAQFIIAPEATTNDTIIIIDITWPVPDSVSWEFGEGIIVNESTYDYAEISFEEAGEYYITMNSAMGNCSDFISKSITILEGNEYDNSEQKTQKKSLIKNFTIYPNPNNGEFIAKAELNRIAEARIKIIGLSSNTILYEKTETGSTEYEFYYNIPSLQPGLYIIMLQAENETKSLRIVIY